MRADYIFLPAGNLPGRSAFFTILYSANDAESGINRGY